MRLSFIFLNLSLLFLVACSTTFSPTIKDINAQPIIKKAFTPVLDSNFRGQLYIKDNQAFFKNCASEQTFSVEKNNVLNNVYKKLTGKHHLPVYLEFTGEIVFSKRPTNNPDAAIIRIDDLQHMAIAKTSLQCAKTINTSLLQAKGESPYWRLNIDGQNLYFATKKENQVYQINKVNIQANKQSNIQGVTEQEAQLDLSITPDNCYNLKENEYWGYTVKVSATGQDLQGCGQPGWPNLGESFTGYYLNQGPSQSANLTLNPDHTLELSQQANNKRTIATGFWKNNTPNSVVVMLTKRAGKAIREELTFKRTGLTLSTLQINQDNIVETFDYPLVFNKMNMKENNDIKNKNSVARVFTPENLTPAKTIDSDIQKAVNQYFKIHRTDPQNTRFNALKYDLNGDGIDEAIVFLDWCSNTGCEMLIFEGSKKGYRFSSRISQISAPITLAKEQHFLWQSLLINKGGQILKLDFDGISYPINSNHLTIVNKKEATTGVELFSQGLPQHWFPIKS